MANALEVTDVRVSSHGIHVFFSNGRIGGYSAVLLAPLYEQWTDLRTQLPRSGRAPHGLLLVGKTPGHKSSRGQINAFEVFA
jgi:hypothetical protein